MKRLLVIRFSAMGDVAMSAPVVWSLATQYPQLQITVLSRKVFAPFYEHMPANVQFLGADLKGEHKGFAGLFKLFNQLRKIQFDAVADFHHVMRSIQLRGALWLCGCKTAHIKKERAAKRRLTQPENKQLYQLKTSFERYADVLSKLGLPVELNFTSVFNSKPQSTEAKVGIAPFAAHKGKIYPPEKMEQVVAELSKLNNIHIYLFGGGKTETEILKSWEARYANVEAMPGKINMSGEIALMNQLDVMVSMDSGNMHLASLSGTPVVSVWGATHRYSGFLGWGQTVDNVVEVDMPCRPCSVFGNKPCLRGDYACLSTIEPKAIIDKIMKQISNKVR